GDRGDVDSAERGGRQEGSDDVRLEVDRAERATVLEDEEERGSTVAEGGHRELAYAVEAGARRVAAVAVRGRAVVRTAVTREDRHRAMESDVADPIVERVADIEIAGF